MRVLFGFALLSEVSCYLLNPSSTLSKENSERCRIFTSSLATLRHEWLEN